MNHVILHKGGGETRPAQPRGPTRGRSAFVACGWELIIYYYLERTVLLVYCGRLVVEGRQQHYIKMYRFDGQAVLGKVQYSYCMM